MVYVFVGADGITSGMYILVEFSIFCHPLKSGEFVDMTGLSDLIVDGICRVIPVYIYIDGFGGMKLRSKEIIIDCSSGNGAKKESSGQNG